MVGYRPVSNLSTIEKLIEEIMKRQLTDFVESENIILQEHYGGCVNHGTMSGKCMIEYNAGKIICQQSMSSSPGN